MINLDNIYKENNSIYLIYGEDEFLKNKLQKDFIDKSLSQSMQMMNLDIFDEKNSNVNSIIDAFSTAPFMSEKRLIIVKNSGLFSDGRKNDSNLMQLNLETVPNTSILIFFEKKVDKRQKLYKETAKKGIVYEITNPSQNDLIKWITNTFEDNNKKISRDYIILLMRNVGYDMNVLTNEINKLISFKSNENKISKQDINSVCTKSIESKIFDLVDAIGNKNLSTALSNYKNMIINREKPIHILNMVARQFRIIFQTKYLSSKNFNTIEISRKLSLRNFIVDDALSQSKYFTNKSLMNALEDCLKTDKNIKTGFMQDEIAVELLIIKYASR